MEKHHQRLLETGDVTIPKIVESISNISNGHPMAIALYLIYSAEAYTSRSLTIHFSFEKFHNLWKFPNNELRKVHKVLLDHKCIEHVKGNDKRKNYIKILV